MQGLLRTKIIEIEKLMNKNALLCLTETQQKIDNNRYKIRFMSGKNLFHIEKKASYLNKIRFR